MAKCSRVALFSFKLTGCEQTPQSNAVQKSTAQRGKGRFGGASQSVALGIMDQQISFSDHFEVVFASFHSCNVLLSPFRCHWRFYCPTQCLSLYKLSAVSSRFQLGLPFGQSPSRGQKIDNTYRLTSRPPFSIQSPPPTSMRTAPDLRKGSPASPKSGATRIP